MTKKVIYKITRTKFEFIEVTTPEEESLIKELNRDFERMEKSDSRFRARCISLDELFETQGFEIPDESTIDDDDSSDKDLFSALLHSAIESLSKKQRQYIYMHYFENKSQVEIAKELNVSKACVSITLERALVNLRKKIKKK